MKARVIVNRHKVRDNKKHGRNDPCISIRTYKSIEYAKEIGIQCPHCAETVFKLLQDFENPVCSGATVWLEGERENIIILKGRQKDD